MDILFSEITNIKTEISDASIPKPMVKSSQDFNIFNTLPSIKTQLEQCIENLGFDKLENTPQRDKKSSKKIKKEANKENEEVIRVKKVSQTQQNEAEQKQQNEYTKTQLEKLDYYQKNWMSQTNDSKLNRVLSKIIEEDLEDIIDTLPDGYDKKVKSQIPNGIQWEQDYNFERSIKNSLFQTKKQLKELKFQKLYTKQLKKKKRKKYNYKSTNLSKNNSPTSSNKKLKYKRSNRNTPLRQNSKPKWLSQINEAELIIQQMLAAPSSNINSVTVSRKESPRQKNKNYSQWKDVNSQKMQNSATKQKQLRKKLNFIKDKQVLNKRQHQKRLSKIYSKDVNMDVNCLLKKYGLSKKFLKTKQHSHKYKQNFMKKDKCKPQNKQKKAKVITKRKVKPLIKLIKLENKENVQEATKQKANDLKEKQEKPLNVTPYQSQKRIYQLIKKRRSKSYGENQLKNILNSTTNNLKRRIQKTCITLQSLQPSPKRKDKTKLRKSFQFPSSQLHSFEKKLQKAKKAHHKKQLSLMLFKSKRKLKSRKKYKSIFIRPKTQRRKTKTGSISSLFKIKNQN